MFTFPVIRKIKTRFYSFLSLLETVCSLQLRSKMDEMNTVHITFIVPHVANEDKDEKSALNVRVLSLQSSVFSLQEPPTETLTTSI